MLVCYARELKEHFVEYAEQVMAALDKVLALLVAVCYFTLVSKIIGTWSWLTL